MGMFQIPGGFLGLSIETWAGAVLGAILGALVIPGALYLSRVLVTKWRETRPALRVLEGIANQEEICKIFVRNLYAEQDLIAVEPRLGPGRVPNVHEVWPDSEGRGVANIFNVLGQVNKTQNIEIVRMSQDIGEWNCHVIVLGAQANKSFDFYRLMENVAYRMDGDNIYNNLANEVVEREEGFGYGIILKSLNPYNTSRKGIGILIGGFGVLGTAAATYYFREYFRDLGNDFRRDCFGIVVRAPVTAGEEAVERLKDLDIRFSPKPSWLGFLTRGQHTYPISRPSSTDGGDSFLNLRERPPVRNTPGVLGSGIAPMADERLGTTESQTRTEMPGVTVTNPDSLEDDDAGSESTEKGADREDQFC